MEYGVDADVRFIGYHKMKAQGWNRADYLGSDDVEEVGARRGRDEWGGEVHFRDGELRRREVVEIDNDVVV